ncbi:MAG: T9SS type A sorting domain-containing protein [Ignavibacteriales bacterium]|nr:T9SS type A sorting domain-containing protein [Ignavibacteriales bacterium]
MMFSGRYAGQFKLRTTVSSGVTSYTDLSLDITQNQNGELLQYKVVALFQSKPDEPSNIQKIRFYFNEEKNVFEVNQTMDFELSQNIPNPFNPSTSISYSIPENAFVTLKIYDVLGNEVEVLINEQKESGNYQIDFNASELSSGIYYYTLTAGNFTSTKKMILVK